MYLSEIIKSLFLRLASSRILSSKEVLMLRNLLFEKSSESFPMKLDIKHYDKIRSVKFIIFNEIVNFIRKFI